MQFSAVLFVILSAILLSNLSTCDTNHKRERRTPDKYDDHYDKFIAKHFSDLSSKYVDGKDEYKNAANDNESYEEEDEEEADNPKENVESNDNYSYSDRKDYERIKALSEAEVAKLQEKPGNCEHFEKDGMICAACKNPETGDTSESCAYSSEPHDKKVAYLTKKSHNYKSPVEVEEPVDDEKESEDQEEAPVTPSTKDSNPAKQYKSEIEDAGDYGAYKLASYNSDVDDYDEPKFAHLKVEPNKNDKPKGEFEILPQSQFKTKNLNDALTDFQTKDWSKCRKVKKGDMTCYYCKDAKGVTQEECMFISSSNPKDLRVERRESKQYDHNSRKPLPSDPDDATKSAPLKVAPVISNNRQKFARLRMARPLMPTKPTVATTEPLITPKITTNIDPNNSLNSDPSFKKTIKRTVSYKKRIVGEHRKLPSDTKASEFETHINHE